MMTAQITSTDALLAENAELKKDIHWLREQVKYLKQQLFGKKSEKIIEPNKDVLWFPGLEPSTELQKREKKPVPAHERKPPVRSGKDALVIPDDLPVEKTILDIPEEEKICKETGLPLVKIGEEVTRKLAHRPGSYFVKEIVRIKYASQKAPDLGIAVASMPESLLERCQADESLLADILVKKFCDHLPLYRQTEIFSRDGIQISRQILSKWVIRCGMALKPLVDMMTTTILKSGNIFIDEIPINMLSPGKGKTQQGYMWVLVGGKASDPPHRVYGFFENRKHSNVDKLIKEYSETLHSDKYGAYEALAAKKQITWCPCYAHIRRKFIEVEQGDLEFKKWILRKLRYLFMLERVAWARSPEERLEIRQNQEIAIIDEIIAAVKEQMTFGNILPKSKMKIALGYIYSLIPYLKNYLTRPFARLDNNVAERAVRPLAIGRKNWLFFGNDEGGEAAAVIFSLVQTCRGLKINPREYLEDVMRRVMSHPANKLHEMLPDQWAAAQQLSLRN